MGWTIELKNMDPTKCQSCAHYLQLALKVQPQKCLLKVPNDVKSLDTPNHHSNTIDSEYIYHEHFALK
jgi:hypothetical protein